MTGMKILLRFVVLVGLFSHSPMDKLWAQSEGEDFGAIYQAIKRREVSVLKDKPIHIRSTSENEYLSAEVYAIVPYSLSALSQVLTDPSSWCDFVALHINIKACTYTEQPQPTLNFYVGRKFYEPPEDAYLLRYQFNVLRETDRGFTVSLRAAEGPLETGDYLIKVAGQRFDNEVLLNMTASYKTSNISRIATSVYLLTLGAGKVGFSKTADDKGEMVYIKGVKGIIERNVMRYYLALTVYMDSLSHQTPNIHMERAASWYDAIAVYRRQLHELERQEFLQNKEKEFENQKILQRQLN